MRGVRLACGRGGVLIYLECEAATLRHDHR